jgi:trans-2,3-dihydro-3-hydroxyanthranilate isomerase
MRIPFRLLDVFTDRPLAGNQLCVVPDPLELRPEAMQAIALEIGFSETTFVTEAAGDRYAIRIFTPRSEISFAGHPTLGTAFVLAAEGRIEATAKQSCAGGEFPVTVDLDRGVASMLQLPAWFGPEATDRSAVATVVGLEPQDLDEDLPALVVSTGAPYLIVPAADEDAVGRARPDSPGLARLLDESSAEGCYLFAIGEEGAKARMFDSDVGEDAATGSAAGPLGAYLAEYGAFRGGPLRVSQGDELGRPSTLVVETRREHDAWLVHVSGGVVIVGRGEFDVTM